jgi:hypothetical protein
MKFIVGVSLSLFALSCAPGGPAVPPAPTADHAVVTRTSEDARVREVTSLEPTGSEPQITTSQMLYVPVYSHVYFGHDKRHFNLACTLSVKNIDPRRPITLTTVDYHNTAGDLIRGFIDRPATIAPLQTVDFYIKERDTTGGSGANFIVRWGSPTAVNAPVVEAVMIGVAEGQGISFVCPAREIAE